MNRIQFSILSIMFLFPAHAAPPGYVALPSQTANIPIQGQTATVTYSPSFFVETVGGKLSVKLHVEGDLGDFQSKVPGVLNGQKQHDECGDRVNVFNTALVSHGAIARLQGNVRYERWECVCTKIPEFRGLKVTFKNRCAKTRLLSQSATICVDMSPTIVNSGRGVALRAVVTCAKPSSNSLLGRINSVVSLEGEFRHHAQKALEEVKDKLTIAFPPEVASLSPTLTGVQFTTLGNGRLGLVASAEVSADAVALMQLVNKLQSK